MTRVTGLEVRHGWRCGDFNGDGLGEPQRGTVPRRERRNVWTYWDRGRGLDAKATTYFGQNGGKRAGSVQEGRAVRRPWTWAINGDGCMTWGG